MSSDQDRTIPPEAIKAINEWREEAKLALDTSEGHVWIAFWYSLHRLQMKTDELLGLDLHRGARLPITPERQAEISSEFAIPDTVPLDEEA